MRNGHGANGGGTWRLRIAREPVGGVLVLTAAGRLGEAGSGTLIETVVAAVEEGHRRFLLDLGGVDYASSAGLLALDAISGRIALDSGTLVLCTLTDPVRVVLELSGLLPQFTVAPDRQAGLALFAEAAGLQTSSAPSKS